MKINTSVAVKAGLIGAGAGLVAALIMQIPFLGCLVSWLGWVVALATGALYVYFSTAKVELPEGAAGGALAGAIAGLVHQLVNGLWDLIFRQGGFVGNIILQPLLGIVSGAIAGAIGGLIWSFVKGRK